MLGKLQQTTVSQQQYRTSEERLAVAIKGTNDGLWEWDLETNVVWYAPRYKEMLGYEEIEFPNLLTSFETHLHPDDAESTEKAIKMHLEKSIDYNVEHRLRKKSGEYCWFRARGAVVRDGSGKAVGCLAQCKTSQKEKNISRHWSVATMIWSNLRLSRRMTCKSR